MHDNKLLKTNLLVSVILLFGFILTAVFSYKANYSDSLKNIEHLSSLTADGIYYQIRDMFTKPLNTSLAMSHDSLLVKHIEDEYSCLDENEYVKATKDYLYAYKTKYGFDSVFLVSCASSRYYSFNGLDRTLSEGNPENNWYYDFMESDADYNLEIDNDEVEGASNEITVFINCKVFNESGDVIGIVGVGIRIEHLKEVLEDYDNKFYISSYLVDSDGKIEISTTYNGYDRVNWFEIYEQQSIKEKVLNWKDNTEKLELWQAAGPHSDDKNYVVVRYIPELSWHLIVKYDTGQLVHKMHVQLIQTCIWIILIIISVLVVISHVIKRFNEQILKLTEERQLIFRKATEEMYDNIYELNITKNIAEGERTMQYFVSLGAGGLSYDDALKVIAEKQIKEEFREGYISLFSTENVIKEYEHGNNHLRYEFLTTQDGKSYYWMRIDAHIFHLAEDNTIRMFVYRKNIDAEKMTEIQAETDEMTGFFTKKATERMIQSTLDKNSEQLYAFFIFDIDNFKTANDRFGHAFGDFCIKEFTGIIKRHFRRDDILGRIGGDEFAAFVAIPNTGWVAEKAKALSSDLDTICKNKQSEWKMSASIGIAVSIGRAADFDTLYRNADRALYQVKQKGRNGFVVYNSKLIH